MAKLNAAEVEQPKLLANAFDRASTASITVGIFTPLAGYGYNIANFSNVTSLQMTTVLTGWLSLAAILHFVARLTLRRLP
jgi:mannose/fructose/N-acetylgalactosamine-specific phosphotransferase system component IID